MLVSRTTEVTSFYTLELENTSISYRLGALDVERFPCLFQADFLLALEGLWRFSEIDHARKPGKKNKGSDQLIIEKEESPGNPWKHTGGDYTVIRCRCTMNLSAYGFRGPTNSTSGTRL